MTKPGFEKFTKEVQTDDVEEFSIFNQAAIYFKRQDKFLTYAHDLHYDCSKGFSENGGGLILCFHALRHSYLITKHTLNKFHKRKLDTLLNNIATSINIALKKKKMTTEEYTKIHNEQYDFLDLLYEAQQAANVGIPTEKNKSARQKLREIMKK